VEDHSELKLEYSNFSALHLSSWSVEGYAEPELRIQITTTKGSCLLQQKNVMENGLPTVVAKVIRKEYLRKKEKFLSGNEYSSHLEEEACYDDIN